MLSASAEKTLKVWAFMLLVRHNRLSVPQCPWDKSAVAALATPCTSPWAQHMAAKLPRMSAWATHGSGQRWLVPSWRHRLPGTVWKAKTVGRILASMVNMPFDRRRGMVSGHLIIPSLLPRRELGMSAIAEEKRAPASAHHAWLSAYAV